MPSLLGNMPDSAGSKPPLDSVFQQPVERVRLPDIVEFGRHLAVRIDAGIDGRGAAVAADMAVAEADIDDFAFADDWITGSTVTVSSG